MFGKAPPPPPPPPPPPATPRILQTLISSMDQPTPETMAFIAVFTFILGYLIISQVFSNSKKPAPPCSPQSFCSAFDKGDIKALKRLNTSKLVTRLVVRSEKEFAEQLADRTNARLNSKQAVFVTPAASWIDWLESTQQAGKDSPSRSYKALDFVGWESSDISWAKNAKKSAKIYVWTEGEDEAWPATWDSVFDQVVPTCARGASTFEFAKGVSKPASWWHDDSAENVRFADLCSRLRKEIADLGSKWPRDSSVGVPEALEARTEDQPKMCRQALKNILYLDTLFAGDGFTRNKKGEKKAAELIAMTNCLADLKDFAVASLGLV